MSTLQGTGVRVHRWLHTVRQDQGDRLAKGDPRLSLEERYPSFTDFYYQARMILNQLVAQRYMRSEDAAAELNAALNGVS